MDNKSQHNIAAILHVYLLHVYSFRLKDVRLNDRVALFPVFTLVISSSPFLWSLDNHEWNLKHEKALKHNHIWIDFNGLCHVIRRVFT